LDVSGFLSRLQSFAESLGAPGIFVIAFLDSSFLSLPQINDLIIVLGVAKRPALMPLYATMATLGSIAGCTIMYYIGRKGGDALLQRRFSKYYEWARRQFDRHGMLAIVVPALLPPPAPFKVFVMAAGAAHMSRQKFWMAIAVGRGIRYFAEGLLAVLYGEQALAYISEHGRTVSLWTALTVAGAGIAYIVWRRRRSRSSAV
jgi:membrane protein YqaA with SNARE-associated domain